MFVVNFYMIYFAHKKILFMHYMFAPFKQLLSEDCSYSIKIKVVASEGSYRPLSHEFKSYIFVHNQSKKIGGK